MSMTRFVLVFFLTGVVCLFLFPQSAQAGCSFLPDGDYVCGGRGAAVGAGKSSGGSTLVPVGGGANLTAPGAVPLMDLLGGSGSSYVPASSGNYTYEEAIEAFDKIGYALGDLPFELQEAAMGVFEAKSIEELVSLSKGDISREDACHNVYFLGENIGRPVRYLLGDDSDIGCTMGTGSSMLGDDGGG